MNEKVGLVSFRMDREAFDKPYSDETARLIDEEVRPKSGSGLLNLMITIQDSSLQVTHTRGGASVNGWVVHGRLIVMIMML